MGSSGSGTAILLSILEYARSNSKALPHVSPLNKQDKAKSTKDKSDMLLHKNLTRCQKTNRTVPEILAVLVSDMEHLVWRLRNNDSEMDY